VLDCGVPWQGAVINDLPEVMLVIYPDRGEWKVQTVPVRLEERGKRMDLPKAWWGKEGAELVNLSQIPDATFCHAQGYIAGAKTLAGAVDMAKYALSEKE
jgi:uncharacterized UPF0160 family protein